MQRSARFVRTLAWILLVLPSIAPAFAADPIPAEPLKEPASASPCLKYLPKDYWMVAELNVETVMQFFNSPQAKQNPQMAQWKQMMQLAKLMSGIDPETEVERITFFAAGNPDDKLNGLVAIQGSFNNNVVENRLSSNAVSEANYKGKTVYSVAEAAFCFPENSTLLFGDERQIHNALDQSDAKSTLPESLKNVLDRTPASSTAWGAVRPQTLLALKDLADWRAANAQTLAVLKKFDCVSLAGDVSDDGLSFNALGYVPASGEGATTFQYLDTRKKDILQKDGSNVFCASFLILSELHNRGPYVQGSFRLTGKALSELWETKVIVKPGK